MRSLYAGLGIDKGPETPPGVYARIVEGRTLYVNTTGEEKNITIRGSKRGVITGTSYSGVIRLKSVRRRTSGIVRRLERDTRAKIRPP